MVEVKIQQMVAGETKLCGLLKAVTNQMGGVGESLYYHLSPSVRSLETTAAGKLVLASAAIRAGIPQKIGEISEAIAPYSNPVVDSAASTGKYVVGKTLKGAAKIIAGDSTISEMMQDGYESAKNKVYDNTVGYASEFMNSAMGKGAESAAQAYEKITAGLGVLQENATTAMNQGVEAGKGQSTKVVESSIKAVEENVNKLAEIGNSYKDQAYTAAQEGITTVQKGFSDLTTQGIDNASKVINSAVEAIQSNSANLKDQAIAFAKENQTALTVVGGAAALAAVGYLSYTAYNDYVAKNEHKIEDEQKSMAAKVSKEFVSLKNSRIKTMNAEKANIADKFQELQTFLKDTNDLSMIRLSKGMVYKYEKDQTVDPEDVRKIQEMAAGKIQGAGLSADKITKLQETSAELMASVMMCDQITKDLSQGRVSPSFVSKVVAEKQNSQQRSRSE